MLEWLMKQNLFCTQLFWWSIIRNWINVCFNVSHLLYICWHSIAEAQNYLSEIIALRFHPSGTTTGTTVQTKIWQSYVLLSAFYWFLFGYIHKVQRDFTSLTEQIAPNLCIRISVINKWLNFFLTDSWKEIKALANF